MLEAWKRLVSVGWEWKGRGGWGALWLHPRVMLHTILHLNENQRPAWAPISDSYLSLRRNPLLWLLLAGQIHVAGTVYLWSPKRKFLKPLRSKKKKQNKTKLTTVCAGRCKKKKKKSKKQTWEITFRLVNKSPFHLSSASLSPLLCQGGTPDGYHSRA